MTETGSSLGGKRFEGPGGTPGGVGEFLIGLVLFGIGIYLLFDRVTVHTSFWNLGGRSAFGISLIPVVIGIAVLFFKGTSVLGWFLTLGGLLFILVGIITKMDIYFERTSLWNTLIMLALLGAGMGLVAKSFRPHRGRDAS
jgi:multisubunit Na+/H+ antiporter MnhF subunit